MSRGTKCGLLASDNRWSPKRGNFAILDNSTAYIPKIKGFYNGKCYRDRRRRDLPLFLGVFPRNKQCIDRAGSFGLPYAGIQFGGQCWGGWKPGSYGSSNNCRMIIRGERKGGVWANNVYRTKIGRYIPSNIFKNGIVRSLQIFGNNCKFGNRKNTGLYRNLKLKGFNTSCAHNQARPKLAFGGCGRLFQRSR